MPDRKSAEAWPCIEGSHHCAWQGDRVSNIQEALRLLPAHDIQVGDLEFCKLFRLRTRTCDTDFATQKGNGLLHDLNCCLQIVRQSRLYESAPAYVTDQPRFINAAVAVKTSLQPRQLLHALKKIEVGMLSCVNQHLEGNHILFGHKGIGDSITLCLNPS